MPLTHSRHEHRFVFRVSAPGHELDDEETVVRAENRIAANAIATERAVLWGVDLQFVGVRVGDRLEIQVPAETLPASWREQAAS